MMLLIVVVVMEVVATATNTDVSFIFNSPWRSSQGVTPSSNT